MQLKYTSLQKKYDDLFSRTAILLKASRKFDQSKQDLERSVHFLRAELSIKGALKGMQNQKHMVFVG